MHSENNQKCCSEEHSGCGACCAQPVSIPSLTKDETEILNAAAVSAFLPIVKFILKSSQSDHFESVAFAPVYLSDPTDDMDKVRIYAAALTRLKDLGLITLDYDVPLKNFDYGIFAKSTAYKYFESTVKDAKDMPDFVFDVATMEYGSLALTPQGQDVAQVV